MKTVYWFNELSKDSIPEAGGKGANLGEMFQNKFPIPEGFVVSAGAYFDFVNENGLEAVIREKTKGLDVEDNDSLEAASSAIRDAIMAGTMSQDTRAEVVRAYNKLCGASLIPTEEEQVLVAVRSSATAEDLPEASFAGQQATYLNVKGGDELVDAVKQCWSSLFTNRAVYYRQQKGFDHLKVGIAVVVQRMVQSVRSGVMFTVDPMSQVRDTLVIEAGFGLGEAVVSGAISPDHYEFSKSDGQITRKQVNVQEWMIIKDATGRGDAQVDVPEKIRGVQKLPDAEVVKLAQIGIDIENHYGAPQDIEWAQEGGKLYIVQSRGVTTLDKPGKSKAAAPSPAAPESATQSPSEKGGEAQVAGDNNGISVDKAKVLLQGLGASPGIAFGPVKIIHSLSELGKVSKGDVLVTEMTTPDFVPAMKRATAIVTNQGGSTCHAAIVSRELGIPCVVGTKTATEVLPDGGVITVDAKRGVVYEGKVAFEETKTATPQEVAAAVVQSKPIVTGTKIYVNVAEPDVAERVALQNVDGVGLLRAEFMIANIGKHPKFLLENGRRQEFVDTLANGLRKVCSAFYPRPVIYRATDFKTNEYKNLEGGAKYEPAEENPMIGYRGCARYVKDPEVFKMELEAIKKVREESGMKNLWLMIPFVRTVHEFRVCRNLVREYGLHHSYDFKLGIMCEVPSTVINAEEFCKAGAEFFSIGSNDLTQLTLGVDRDNATMADTFDERDPSVLKSVKHVIEACHKHGVKIGICGQAPSVYPEFAEAIVEYGIDSISCNPDVIDVTRKIVSSAEKKVELKRVNAIYEMLSKQNGVKEPEF